MISSQVLDFTNICQNEMKHGQTFNEVPHENCGV